MLDSGKKYLFQSLSTHGTQNIFNYFSSDPNGPGIPTWPLVTNSTFVSMQFLQIGNENGLSDNEVLHVKEDYYSARAEFWKKIRQDYNLNSWLDENNNFS